MLRWAVTPEFHQICIQSVSDLIGFTVVYVFTSTLLRIYSVKAPAVQTRAVYRCLVVFYFVRQRSNFRSTETWFIYIVPGACLCSHISKISF